MGRSASVNAVFCWTVPESPKPTRAERNANGDADLTAILEAAARGDASAGPRLIELLYSELRQLAASHLARTPPGNTLQPTALVHEAYMKLIGNGSHAQSPPRFEGRAHFFGAASRAMREILVDQSRRKATAKRGGGAGRADLATLDRLPMVGDARDDLPDLDRVLRKLEAELPRKAEIVLLRYFAGLTIEQVAEVLGVTTRTVNRDWLFAKAWLQRELEQARTLEEDDRHAG